MWVSVRQHARAGKRRVSVRSVSNDGMKIVQAERDDCRNGGNRKAGKPVSRRTPKLDSDF
jgi:hypothetical protein